MRRLISSILAVLVLILSLLPCDDVEGMQAPYVATQASIGKAKEHKPGGHGADLCSPFCTCACCSGFTLPLRLELQAPLVPLSYVRQAFYYVPQRIAAVSMPVWQPPQLV